MRCARTAVNQYFKDHFVVLINMNKDERKREGYYKGYFGHVNPPYDI